MQVQQNQDYGKGSLSADAVIDTPTEAGQDKNNRSRFESRDGCIPGVRGCEKPLISLKKNTVAANVYDVGPRPQRSFFDESVAGRARAGDSEVRHCCGFLKAARGRGRTHTNPQTY